MVVFIPFDIQRNAHFVCLFKKTTTHLFHFERDETVLLPPEDF